MPYHFLVRRRRWLQLTPKRLAFALALLGFFLLIVMMLRQANTVS